MRKLSPFLSVFVMVLAWSAITSSVHGQETSVDLKAPVCKIISLPYLLGEIAIELGDRSQVEQKMPCLLQLWNEQLPSSNENNRSMSNGILFVMEANPQAFFSAMASKPDEFSGWLKDLPINSFMPVNFSTCGIQTKRAQFVSVLENSKVIGAKEQALRKSVIVRLTQIQDAPSCQ
jgi:hypothetical protein